MLLSPIEQFDLTLEDIKNVVSNSSIVLTEEWIQSVRKENDERRNANYDSEQQLIRNNVGNTSITSSFTKILKNSLLSTYCNTTTTTTTTMQGGGILSSCSVIMRSDKEYAIVTSRENYSNAKKGVAGSWTGTFQLLLSGGINNTDENRSQTTECTLSGTVQLKAHVYETDNVQMNSSIVFDATNIAVSPSVNDEQIAEAIANQLLSWDKEILHSLTEFYNNIEDTMLKSSRRILPHSRKRMDWDVKSHRLVSNLHHLNI